MPTWDIMHGSRAVAEAVKLCSVDVISAYPITPQTHIVEDLAKMAADGEIKGEYIKVESEHSAMTVVIAACATGARTFTATASQGLALMHEMLFVASGMRLPIVMVNANRALSAPINIWNDQQDSIAERDAGWIQLYVETNQEALDSTIMAYRIGEDKGVLLPVMVCMDGFVLTHTVEPVEVPDQEDVLKFLPQYKPELYLDPKKPMAQGAFADPSVYMELRFEQQKAIENSLEVIKDVDKEFKKIFGRGYGGLIEEFNMKGAEVVIVTLGSVAGTIKDVIQELEDNSVGLLRIKAFRPLPKEEIKKALEKAKVVGVIEKDVSIGLGQGALASEIRDVMYGQGKAPKVISFVAGLGGRDIGLDSIKGVISVCKKALEEEVGDVHWVDLKTE
ncbi:MAG: pyruvate synthase subunit PorA [Candidatus Hydrothermarchaeales archaeon]